MSHEAIQSLGVFVAAFGLTFVAVLFLILV